MNDQTQRKRGRPARPDALTNAEHQQKFRESMRAKGLERLETWVPIELRPMVLEANRQLIECTSEQMKDLLRKNFVVAVMEALNRQRSIMLNAQWLRDNGYQESIVDEYIEDCIHCYEFSVGLDAIRNTPEKFIQRREAETMTT